MVYIKSSIETDSLTLICKTTGFRNYHIWVTLQKTYFVSHPRTCFVRLTWVQAGFIISLRFFQIILVLLCFIFDSGLKLQLLSEIHSHLRIFSSRYACKEKISTLNTVADGKWQWIKKYFVMDLAENVPYHETFFIKPSTIALNFVVALYRENVLQWIDGIVGLCKIPSCCKI